MSCCQLLWRCHLYAVMLMAIIIGPCNLCARLPWLQLTFVSALTRQSQSHSAAKREQIAKVGRGGGEGRDGGEGWGGGGGEGQGWCGHGGWVGFWVRLGVGSSEGWVEVKAGKEMAPLCPIHMPLPRCEGWLHMLASTLSTPAGW